LVYIIRLVQNVSSLRQVSVYTASTLQKNKLQ